MLGLPVCYWLWLARVIGQGHLERERENERDENGVEGGRWGGVDKLKLDSLKEQLYLNVIFLLNAGVVIVYSK